MSCSEKKNIGGGRRGEQGENDSRKSVEQQSSKSGSQNGSVMGSCSVIDERVLVDPKLLFIGSKIGQGAHGKVYQGRYGDQIVAIKVLNRGSNPEEKDALESRFAREVNMMSRVKHDNLVKFIGACKDPLMVIVTELLPGMSLRKYLLSIRPNQLDLHMALNFPLTLLEPWIVYMPMESYTET